MQKKKKKTLQRTPIDSTTQKNIFIDFSIWLSLLLIRMSQHRWI